MHLLFLVQTLYVFSFFIHSAPFLTLSPHTLSEPLKPTQFSKNIHFSNNLIQTNFSAVAYASKQPATNLSQKSSPYLFPFFLASKHLRQTDMFTDVLYKLVNNIM